MPPPTSPRQYNPSVPGYARRIKPEVWRMFQKKITMLHNQGRTKKEILAALENDTLANQQSFHPTVGQLFPQMKAWGLTAAKRGSIFASEETEKIEIPVATSGMVFEESRNAEDGATVNGNQALTGAPNGAVAWSHNAQTVSNVSSTPPLTGAESSSKDDFSLDDRSLELGVQRRLLEQVQCEELISAVVAGNQNYDVINTLGSPFNSDMIFDHAMPSSLLALWPGNKDPQTLRPSQLCEIRGTATSLAAAGLFDDAFDLFHVEYNFWKAPSSLITKTETIGHMVMATINCSRTCRSSRREEIGRQLIRNTHDILMKHGLGYSLESALLHLYLSNLLERRRLFLSQELRDLQDAALRMVVDCTESCFTIISPEFQDREYLFMAEALEKLSFRLLGLRGPGASFVPLVLNTIAEPKHLTDCEDMTTAIETLLKWSKDFIQENSRELDQAGDLFLKEADFHHSAPWFFYCCCVCELSIFDPSAQSELAISQVQLCTHGSRHLTLDTPLALAVIAESFLTSGTDKTEWQFSDVWFSSYCLGKIDRILNNMPMKCRDITKAYVSRIIDLPQPPKVLDPLWDRSSELVRKYISAAVEGHRSLPAMFTVLSRIMAMVFPLQPLFMCSSPLNSMPSSVRSSINTTGSSMSFDTKQMLELKVRLRGPKSLLSIRSKDTRSSNTRSIKSHQSDSFEKVTGMPSWDPVEDLLNERIDEEMSDNEMSDVEISIV